MTTKMTRETFEAWLLAQEETVARRHVEAIVKAAPDHYYPPVTAPALIALATLARHFDERHADKLSLAEELRTNDSFSYPEHRAVADTYEAAASTVWALCGGRPNDPADPYVQRDTIKIDVRELGKLVEMATHPLYVLHVPTAAPQPSETLGEFGEALVERLAQVGWDAFATRANGANALRWADVVPSVMEGERAQVRAILTTLGSMPCDLPSPPEVSKLIWSDNGEELVGNKSRRVLDMIRTRVGPVLAAKDALIAQYDEERNRNARMVAAVHDAIADSKHLMLRQGDGNALVTAIKDADARIAELERTTEAPDPLSRWAEAQLLQHMDAEVTDEDKAEAAKRFGETTDGGIYQVARTCAAVRVAKQLRQWLYEVERQLVEKTDKLFNRATRLSNAQERYQRLWADFSHLWEHVARLAETHGGPPFRHADTFNVHDRQADMAPVLNHLRVMFGSGIGSPPESPIAQHDLAEAEKLVRAGYVFEERVPNVIVNKRDADAPLYKLTDQQARIFHAALVKVSSEKGDGQ